jgi:hypothetical protein
VPELQIDENRLRESVLPQLERFTRVFVDRVAAEARRLAPVRTGALRGSINADSVHVTGPWSVTGGVSVRVGYAAPVHEGARPHVIRPRHGSFLRFEIGNRVVFARRVNHPGNRPNPFLRDAAHAVANADPRIVLNDR